MNRNVNIKMAKDKGLIEKNEDVLYTKIENLYKYLFENYLLLKVDMKKYYMAIENSGLSFGKAYPSKKELLSGLSEFLNLDYFYILNSFFIEKLDIKDIETLKNALINNVLSEDLIKIIERTYKDVITNNYRNDQYILKKYKVCYGYAKPDNYANNDALVIKIFYGRNTISMSDDQFLTNIKEKKYFLQKLSEELKEEIENALNIECNVIYEKISSSL